MRHNQLRNHGWQSFMTGSQHNVVNGLRLGTMLDLSTRIILLDVSRDGVAWCKNFSKGFLNTNESCHVLTIVPATTMLLWHTLWNDRYLRVAGGIPIRFNSFPCTRLQFPPTNNVTTNRHFRHSILWVSVSAAGMRSADFIWFLRASAMFFFPKITFSVWY